ncbi:hypothetical protein DM02DRAFT_654789 [Periconia macrospinosa]|uniref:DUF7730 domain-containing protein n=1 Tax=Periconia macrospinosa TaxID=97972 RepID=A0A2V1DS73_9PLEO|nr:hypothetical protein DM02DRAFT_654789 [Periconia macrospinosa]
MVFSPKGMRTSALLTLPTELRLKIWKYVLGNLTIAIFREQRSDGKRGRLTHGILNNWKPPCGPVIKVDGVYTELVQRSQSDYDLLTEVEIDSLDDILRHHFPYRTLRITGKMQLTTLLKICRSVYTETAGLLYSSHHFIFFHNSTLMDLHDMVPRAHFARISSLHVHWWFLESASAEMKRSFTELCGAILAQLPKMRHLSIFFEGRIPLRKPYRLLSETIVEIVQNACPGFFSINLPEPPTEGRPGSAQCNPNHLDFLAFKELLQSHGVRLHNHVPGCAFHQPRIVSWKSRTVGAWLEEEHDEGERRLRFTEYDLSIPDQREGPKRRLSTKLRILRPSTRFLRNMYHDICSRLRKMGSHRA